MDAISLREELIKVLSQSENVLAVGQTGELNPELIPGKSDIDLFVLCKNIPSLEERRNFYETLLSEEISLQMSVCNGGVWGYGDILVINQIDVMPMYFTVDEMKTYLLEVLSGKHLYKEGRFYPVGRLASVSTIHVLYEKDDTWTNLKIFVNEKPQSFFKSWYESEINAVLDEEDLGRSELRKEVLFFHQVLENALDHLIQAIYALNFTYFPSRKRNLEDLSYFSVKPENIEKRLLSLVENGAKKETIIDSINELRMVTEEVKNLGNKVYEA